MQLYTMLFSSVAVGAMVIVSLFLKINSLKVIYAKAQKIADAISRGAMTFLQ